MKKEWKNFIRGLVMPVKFLHRDELINYYNHLETTLPAMFTENDRRPQLLISSKEMNAYTDPGQTQAEIVINRILLQSACLPVVNNTGYKDAM